MEIWILGEYYGKQRQEKREEETKEEEIKSR
jgi:hypothetical protein